MSHSDDTRQPEAEQQLDALLSLLGQEGMLNIELNDADIERVLASAPRMPLSTTFAERARLAMQQAQQAREEHRPAVALGVVLAQARQRADWELVPLGQRIGVPGESIAAIEQGRLSISRILGMFQPSQMVRLLDLIGLPIQEFGSRLLRFAGTGRELSSATIAYRKPGRLSASVIDDVSTYLAEVERLAAPR